VVLTGAAVFLGLGYFLMSRIGAIWQLYLYAMVVAIGGSSAFVCAPSTVARWFVKRRGIMTGIVVSGISLGTMVMSPVASRLIVSYGWRTAYVVIAGIAFILLVAVAQFLRRDPSRMGLSPYGAGEAKVESASSKTEGLSLREAIRFRQFWMINAVYFASILCSQSILVHIVIHAIDLDISALTAANVLAAIGLLSIAGRVTTGVLADRIGNKLALIISFILMTVALVYLLIAKEIWALYLFTVVFGFGYGGMVALQSPLVADLFGLRSHGVIFGTVAYSARIGGALGSFLVGLIFDVTSSYSWAFVLLAAFSTIGLALTALLTPIASEE
jgi:MFS family permease